jgi:hypothetical protein
MGWRAVRGYGSGAYKAMSLERATTRFGAGEQRRRYSATSSPGNRIAP